MRSLLTAIGLATALFLPSNVRAENLPIHVTPYYDSDPLSVRAGEFSEGLRSPNGDVVDEAISTMKDSWSTLQVVPMYIAAIRLYDLGERDQAVYWFYAAQHRAQLFQAALNPEHKGSIGSPSFEFSHAHNAFFQLAGEWINGYAFCDKEVLTQTLKRVVSDSKGVPRFTDAYPDIAFIKASDWAALSAEVSQGLEDLIRAVDEDYSRIKAQRDESGATKRFCGAEG